MMIWKYYLKKQQTSFKIDDIKHEILNELPKNAYIHDVYRGIFSEELIDFVNSINCNHSVSDLNDLNIFMKCFFR